MTEQRYLALDYGNHHIGVAVAESAVGIAFTRPAIDVSDDDTALKKIIQLIEQESPTAVIVGLPITMRGEIGSQAEKTQSFVDQLKAKSPCPVHVVDERMTTTASQRQSPHVNDHSGAARLILETFLAQQQ